MSDNQSRRRWFNLGELIGLGALVVSATGVWITWNNSKEDKLTRVVEQHPTVPLVLRGSTDAQGRTLTLVPADPSQALEALTIAIKGRPSIDLPSDGKLAASDVAAALKGSEKEPKDIARALQVRIEARYVEGGSDRHGGGNYVLRYRWQGGGLFGARSVRLLGLSRN